MGMRVFSVGIRLPGDSAEYIPLRSDRSLFDSDVILFCPHFDDYHSDEFYQGTRVLTESYSTRVVEDVAHWRSELKAAVDGGKVVFVFLRKPEEVHYDTGSRSHSGTGRGRITTRHVDSINSYRMLPVSLEGLTPREGSEIRVLQDLGALAAYWTEFGKESRYEAYYESGKGTDILGTKGREKVVGSLVRTKGGGALVLLPPVIWDEDELVYYRGEHSYWRKEAERMGARLLAALVGASEALRKSGKRSPTPDWVAAPEYRLPAEDLLQGKIAKTDSQLEKLATKRAQLEAELEETRVIHGLLFESGAPLEEAILHVLKMMGFKAERFEEGESEFDAVFTSPEGRFLGEAEGKTSKALNISSVRLR